MELLEQLVRRGGAAAGVGVVDDVVVHQRRRVEELEGGRRRHDGEPVASGLRFEGIEATSADRLPPPVAEPRPEALAAAEKPP